jgi:hypothetical protein
MSKPATLFRRSSHVLIDLDSLMKFRHNCDGCARRASVASCCSGLEVCISKSEMSKIVGIIPYIVKYCHHLLIEAELDNIFNESEDGLYSIDTHINGLCVFAYRKNRRILCGIHSAADGLGLNWYDLKPLPCILWPLAISEDLSPVISLDDSAGSFHCNTEVSDRSPCLDLSVIKILKNVVGNESAVNIDHAASKGLRHIKIPLKGILAARL